MSPQAMATCSICRREVLPHQCAHWTCPGCHAERAICFAHGPSGYDPPFALDRHPGVPIYTQLAAMRVLHECPDARPVQIILGLP